MELNAVGVDLSKSVFQLSITNPSGRITSRRKLSRTGFQRWLASSEPAHLVMEACGTSHYWGRTAQAFGHHVTLLHAHYVKAYVRRSKTDAADADALLQAVRDMDLKPIPVKSEQQQALQLLHRVREQWKSARIARLNEARAILAEFGVTLPRGVAGLHALLLDGADRVPELLRQTLLALIEEIVGLADRTKRLDKQLEAYARQDADCLRLLDIDSVGVTTATATVARVSNIRGFREGRAFSSWLGLTAREHSSGRSRRLGRISKQGDTYLRTLLIQCGHSALNAAHRKAARQQPLTRIEQWALATEQRIGRKKAAVALANKLARIIWAVWSRQVDFNANDADRFAAAA